MPVKDLASILKLAPVIPVIVIERLEDAVPLGQALARGGLPVLEVTLRTPVALAAIQAMRRAIPEAVVGAGTLTRPEDFKACMQVDAQFAVTPGLTPKLVAAAAKAAFPLLPGVMTPTELIAARGAGFNICKLFPAQQAGGVPMLKALHGPFPDARFCPTGGITRQNAPEFLALPNVLCVGGSWVVPNAVVQARDWAAIELLARDAAGLARTHG
ncbi:MAG TPA: bifunctional 4-hydroxy-2-oxoglutarate aldolase/2-dehydro-3-deoxy-phosphogluconate aldolase [Steroidobacteraceae bacterium]|nr:bifunctional 4-hydroxy-2-oxoglutarate aldolase/2-dehydro-3-deoxy-phosphogluconate aldolase [Steroidobacteraceae bacterium]